MRLNLKYLCVFIAALVSRHAPEVKDNENKNLINGS